MALNQQTLAIPQAGSRPVHRPLRVARSVGTFVRRRPLGAVGFLLIGLMVFAAVFAPFVSRYDPNEAFSHPNPGFDPVLYQQSLTDPTVKLKNIAHPEKFVQGNVFEQNAGMSSAHWLGTDPLAHDTWSRIVYGARLSLFVGIGGAVFACTIGTILGLSSGYFGGWIDDVLMRFTDALFTFPPLILLLLIVQVVDKPNKWWITFALGILGIASVVRIVRSTVLSAREEVYVLAAQSIGASDVRIMLRHILPNIFAAVIVVFSISIGGYILAEAGLAFIGLGDPVAISWGKMLDQGRQYGVSAPLFAFWVGMAITLSVLGFNLAAMPSATCSTRVSEDAAAAPASKFSPHDSAAMPLDGGATRATPPSVPHPAFPSPGQTLPLLTPARAR